MSRGRIPIVDPLLANPVGSLNQLSARLLTVLHDQRQTRSTSGSRGPAVAITSSIVTFVRSALKIQVGDYALAIGNPFGVGRIAPLRRAGSKRVNIILDVNGKPIADSNELRMTFSMMQPDANVNLRISRNGAEREVAVQLGELPTTTASAKHNGEKESSVLSGVSKRGESGGPGPFPLTIQQKRSRSRLGGAPGPASIPRSLHMAPAGIGASVSRSL